MTDNPVRLLVTGTKGQIALSLVERGPAHGVEVVTVGRPEIDLASNADLSCLFARVRPDVIVNAAAYTAVDRAESEPDLAQAINGRGAGLVAQAAAWRGVPVVHISTDYVFDGTATQPYREVDPATPLGVYGRSKLAGERAVAEATSDYAILRTAWIYSPFGINFVRTMLRLAATCEEIGVVGDQRGCPNSALEIADGVIAVARNLSANPRDHALRGVFHLTAEGEISWAELAADIFSISTRLGGPSARVRVIATADYPASAPRPLYSRLSGTKLAERHRVRLPDWRASLETSISRMLSSGSTG